MPFGSCMFIIVCRQAKNKRKNVHQKLSSAIFCQNAVISAHQTHFLFDFLAISYYNMRTEYLQNSVLHEATVSTRMEEWYV